MSQLHRKGSFVLKIPTIKAKEGQRLKQKEIKFVPLRIHKYKRERVVIAQETINDSIPCSIERGIGDINVGKARFILLKNQYVNGEA